MATLRQAFPRPVLVLLLAVVAAQAVVAWQLAGSRTAPHDVDLAIAGPPVVAQSLAERANALEGRPLEAFALDEDVDARASVASGATTAALVVDLVADDDVLYVAAMRDPDLVEALAAQAGAVAATFARDVRVELVPTLRNGDVDRLAAYWLALGWVVAGFGVSVVVSWVWGPVARSDARAAVRMVGTALACAALAAVSATAVEVWGYAGAWPRLVLIGWLTMLACALLMLAVESLAGLAGIAVTVAAALLVLTPLASGHDIGLLPAPWPVVTELVPHGAAIESVTDAAYFARLEPRPLLVLAAWIGVSLLTLLVSRRERAGDRVVLPGEAGGAVSPPRR